MANNRMFLVHRPSGLGVMLGKRMAYGWYQPPTQDRMLAFFEHLENENFYDGGQDDFVLCMETAVNAPGACVEWQYTEIRKPDEFQKFTFTGG